MADLPPLSSAEHKCLRDFISVAIEHNKAYLTDYDLNRYSSEFSVPAIFLKKFIHQIANKGIFHLDTDPDGTAYHVHPDYLDAIFLFSDNENILDDSSLYREDLISTDSSKETIDNGGVPAADRFVLRSDNEEAANSASQALSDLSEKIRTSNELKASQEERAALSKEVAGISDLVSQSAIRISAIWDAIHGSGVLRWLAERAADASINALAVEAIKHLTKLCGFG